MADLEILRTRLMIRLPGRSSTELEGWITEAAVQHGYATVADVPDKAVNAIIAYAEYMGIKAKAVETAENASLSIPGKVSIDKSGASSKYTSLIKEAYLQYRREATRAGIKPLSGGMATGGTVVRGDGR